MGVTAGAWFDCGVKTPIAAARRMPIQAKILEEET
jgi:hypothetical protein